MLIQTTTLRWVYKLGPRHSVPGVSMGARVLKKIKRDHQKSETVHYVQESGQSYANPDMRSDVKLKNRPDPYAFIQFNPLVSSSGTVSKVTKQSVKNVRNAHETEDCWCIQRTQSARLSPFLTRAAIMSKIASSTLVRRSDSVPL